MQPGYYRRFDDPGNLPSALSRVAGFPTPEYYRTSVIMASGTSQHPPSIGGVTPAPGTPIYRVATIRYDVHGVGEPHFNKDDVLIFTDTGQRAWQIYARDEARHYQALSIDSGIDAAIELNHWPAAPAGTLAAMQQAGGYVDFAPGGAR